MLRKASSLRIGSDDDEHAPKVVRFAAEVVQVQMAEAESPRVRPEEVASIAAEPREEEPIAVAAAAAAAEPEGAPTPPPLVLIAFKVATTGRGPDACVIQIAANVALSDTPEAVLGEFSAYLDPGEAAIDKSAVLVHGISREIIDAFASMPLAYVVSRFEDWSKGVAAAVSKSYATATDPAPKIRLVLVSQSAAHDTVALEKEMRREGIGFSFAALLHDAGYAGTLDVPGFSILETISSSACRCRLHSAHTSKPSSLADVSNLPVSLCNLSFRTHSARNFFVLLLV